MRNGTPTPAARIAAHAQAGPPMLGAGRLICIDGPSGAGKTTLAEEVAAVMSAEVVHLDDLYPGWDGLPAVGAVVLEMLAELAQGRPGRYRRYDWLARELRETRTVAPSPVLVVEGVGAGDRAWAAWTNSLVWVTAPDDDRHRRALDRDGDGETLGPYWEAWGRAEELHFSVEQTETRADLRFEN